MRRGGRRQGRESLVPIAGNAVVIAGNAVVNEKFRARAVAASEMGVAAGRAL